MKKIGIIAAMEEEFNAIKNIMQNAKNTKIYELTFAIGQIQNKECILVKCGVGKVNAARVTQILIDSFFIEYIINVGSAGALNPLLNIGDIIIGEKVIQHDFDITAFGHPKGYITDVGDIIESEKYLVQKFMKIVNALDYKRYKVKKGIIASGDIFCTDIKMKEKIYQKFNAECVEMEGAAIAQVCHLDNIPFLIIRSISDSPNENNTITFQQYLKLASVRCAEIINKFFEN